jgi:hypothetical protein
MSDGVIETSTKATTVSGDAISGPLTGGEPMPRVWAYATVFGALWGALEITFGAFLHALRLPLVGVFLAAGGLLVLMSGLAIYPARGFALRCGVVCMLLKLISPSFSFVVAAVGIIAEASLVELLVGRGRAGRLRIAIAGGLVALVPIAQFLFDACVIYSWDLIRIYQVAFERFAFWVNAPVSAAYVAVAVGIGLVFAMGSLSALAGRRLGGLVCKMRARENVTGQS